MNNYLKTASNLVKLLVQVDAHVSIPERFNPDHEAAS